MAGAEDLAARLRAAGAGWRTASGTFRTWRDPELATRAFLERHAGRGRVATAVSDVELESPIEHILRVHAADGGRRRRAEALSRVGERWLDELVVVDEPWFWARTGDRLVTNDGDPSSTHGGADFVLLLTPAEVPAGFELARTDETDTVAGRACDVVVAVPKEPDPYGLTPGAEVFDMVSGGHEFHLHVDRETSTLLRVTKLVEGAPAEVAEFLDIAFDGPVDDRLFQPLAPGPPQP